MSWPVGISAGRFSQPRPANQPVRLPATALASLRSAQLEAIHAEAVRSGYSYIGGTTTASGTVAGSAFSPILAPSAALFNGENPGGRSYVIDWIHVFGVSGVFTRGLTLIAYISLNPQIGAFSLRPAVAGTGFSGAAGQARPTKGFMAGGTSFTGNEATTAVGSAIIPTGNVGVGGLPYKLRGRLIVPPGYSLGLVISNTGAAAAFGLSLQWSELELDLE